MLLIRSITKEVAAVWGDALGLSAAVTALHLLVALQILFGLACLTAWLVLTICELREGDRLTRKRKPTNEP